MHYNYTSHAMALGAQTAINHSSVVVFASA